MLLSSSMVGILASLAAVGCVSASRRGLRVDSERSHGGNADLPVPRVIQNENQAKDLAYFQNLGESTERFSWVNSTEVQAGQMTCGFLKPDLGFMPDQAYPSIDVYFCVHFANKQPAVNGNLAIHCGGPGSLSICTPLLEDTYLSEDVLDTYNVISFDQRGMGRSWPNFSHEECAYGIERADNGTIVAAHASRLETLHPKNETGIREFLEQQKERVLSCWTCTTCDFHLNATDDSRQYHFLEFSGTQEAAQDLELFRQVIGAEKLSLLGISYGTQIMATYATLFPDRVDKFILDSSVSPNPDLLHMATESASGLDARLDYLVFACTARNAVKPGSCPVADLGQCFNDVTELIDDMYTDDDLDDDGVYIAQMVLFLSYDDEESWGNLLYLCSAGADQDREAVLEVVDAIRDMLEEAADGEKEKQSRQQVINGDEDSDEDYKKDPLIQYLDAPNKSGPTYQFRVYGNPDYAAIMNTANVPQTMVHGQSMSNGCHDSDYFLIQVREIDQLYSAFNTHVPALQFMIWYSMGFYWPISHPVPPSGHPMVKGLISGQLYDSATPYEWTQEMKVAFPQMKLLTSQWISHGIKEHKQSSLGNNPCLPHITHYLTTGDINVPDGAVCRSGFPGPDDFSFT